MNNGVLSTSQQGNPICDFFGSYLLKTAGCPEVPVTLMTPVVVPIIQAVMRKMIFMCKIKPAGMAYMVTVGFVLMLSLIFFGPEMLLATLTPRVAA